jgi:Putative prokaryotic signal transducing protein
VVTLSNLIHMENTIVYTTAHVFELDTVRGAFKKANIPFYVQSESFGGVKAAFEALPATGFGRRWHVFVPDEAEAHAKEILSTIHISFDSDLKPFPAVSAADFKKYFWKALIIVSPIIAILGYSIYKALTKH